MPDPSPLFDPSDRRRVGWQRCGVRALADLLERAEEAGLPPVQWSLNDRGGDLTARCLDGRRATFDAWAGLLGATRRPGRDIGGATRLHAVVGRVANPHGTHTDLTADLHDDPTT